MTGDVQWPVRWREAAGQSLLSPSVISNAVMTESWSVGWACCTLLTGVKKTLTHSRRLWGNSLYQLWFLISRFICGPAINPGHGSMLCVLLREDKLSCVDCSSWNHWKYSVKIENRDMLYFNWAQKQSQVSMRLFFSCHFLSHHI